MSNKISIRKARTAIPGLLDLISYISLQSRIRFSKFVIAEIGSFVGDSTRVFAGKCKTVHSIDPWMNGYDDKDPSSYTWPMSQVEEQFDTVVSECGNIVKHKMTSLEGAGLFNDGSLDMIYIDGNHTYEAVKQDLGVWIPKLKKGGWICGHDYNHKLCPGTKPAILEIIGTPERTFQDTSWCKRK